MSGPATIARGAPTHPGLDYDALRREGLKHLQNYAGARWTDYNEHDPGVTILEQLCYALTDLAYRAEFDIEDLLGGALLDLPAPWRALPSQPVTADDFRRLLLDRVPAIGNVWLTPRAGGLYDIRIQPGAGEPQHDLVERLSRAFVRHRTLCEDIGSIALLRPARTIVSARIHADRSADPDRVMAEAIHRIALTLAPEPRRIDLTTMMANGTPETVFDGPLPLNGFITAADLRPKPASIDVDTLANRIEAVPGVLGVRDARLWVDGKGVAVNGAWTIDPDSYCRLDAGLDASELPIDIVIGGRARPIDRGRVARLIEDLWHGHRATHPPKRAFRAAFPITAGRPRDLARFAPVAAQFPGAYGLGDGVTTPPTAQARQLLGFIAIFEMAMIDFTDRLGTLRGWIDGSVMDDEVIGSPDFLARIPALAQIGGGLAADGQAPAQPRRPLDQQERMADFLLALHGEDAGDIPRPPHLPRESQGFARYRLAIKHRLLERSSALARRAGRGFDYHARPSLKRLSGIELRLRLLIDDHDVADRRHRRRIGIVEHMMLRPRTAARAKAEGERHDHAMAISVVVDLPDDEHGRRGEIYRTIRNEVPAHIAVRLHVVERPDWRRFAHLHRLWRMALREREDAAIDWTSVALRDLIAALPESLQG